MLQRDQERRAIYLFGGFLTENWRRSCALIKLLCAASLGAEAAQTASKLHRSIRTASWCFGHESIKDKREIAVSHCHGSAIRVQKIRVGYRYVKSATAKPKGPFNLRSVPTKRIARVEKPHFEDQSLYSSVLSAEQKYEPSNQIFKSTSSRVRRRITNPAQDVPQCPVRSDSPTHTPFHCQPPSSLSSFHNTPIRRFDSLFS